jgi:hypothetical protein
VLGAHTHTLLRRQAVDLALDGEQGMSLAVAMSV